MNGASAPGAAPGPGFLERAVAASGRGWPLTDVADWLLSDARLTIDPCSFVDALCERMLGVGAPLWRLRFSFRTLHPEVLALSYLWLRGQRAVELRRLHGVESSDDYIGSPIEHVFTTGTPVRHRLRELDPERDHGVLHEIANLGGTDYLAMPLRFGTGAINSLIISTDHPAGLTDDDIVKFTLLGALLAPIFESYAMRHLARSLLDVYVGPRTGERVLSGRIRRGDGERISAVVWFSDLRDFTPLTESLPPAEMLATLNAYFECVAAATRARGGEILRFIGDAMLIVFTTDSPADVPEACEAAVDAAEDAFSAVATLNHRRVRRGESPIRFGVGLHVGEVIYGNVGASDRLDFTVMGPAVNRTARIESLTKTLGVPLLLSAEVARQLRRATDSLGAHALKGVADSQEIFGLREVASVPASHA